MPFLLWFGIFSGLGDREFDPRPAALHGVFSSLALRVRGDPVARRETTPRGGPENPLRPLGVFDQRVRAVDVDSSRRARPRGVDFRERLSYSWEVDSVLVGVVVTPPNMPRKNTCAHSGPRSVRSADRPFRCSIRPSRACPSWLERDPLQPGGTRGVVVVVSGPGSARTGASVEPR